MSGAVPMVTRCICRSVTFATARAEALRCGARTVAELQRHIDVATGCGLCIPYLQCALDTRADAIPLMSEAETATFSARAGDVLTRESERETQSGSGR